MNRLLLYFMFVLDFVVGNKVYGVSSYPFFCVYAACTGKRERRTQHNNNCYFELHTQSMTCGNISHL